MTYNPEIHHRRSIRLRGYDYTKAGVYFVTLCTKNRERLFGEIVNGEMRLSDYGQIVRETWEWLEQQYHFIELDEYIIMPDHFHGIIIIKERATYSDRAIQESPSPNGPFTLGSNERKTDRDSASQEDLRINESLQSHGPIAIGPNERKKPLGRLIGAFKTVTTKRINLSGGTPGAQWWHRNYYESIIRNEAHLNRVRTYIRNNPLHAEG